jgi:hypothetical protein
MVREAGIEQVTKILGRGIAEQIFEQLIGKRSRSGTGGGDPVVTQSSLLQFR